MFPRRFVSERNSGVKELGEEMLVSCLATRRAEVSTTKTHINFNFGNFAFIGHSSETELIQEWSQGIIRGGFGSASDLEYASKIDEKKENAKIIHC